MLLAACRSSVGSRGPTASAGPAGSAGPSAAPTVPPGQYSKVMLVMEENETSASVLTGGSAPYLAGLAKRFGVATNLQAGYDVSCPSLPSYLILSSGSDQGVCD